MCLTINANAQDQDQVKPTLAPRGITQEFEDFLKSQPVLDDPRNIPMDDAGHIEWVKGVKANEGHELDKWQPSPVLDQIVGADLPKGKKVDVVMILRQREENLALLKATKSLTADFQYLEDETARRALNRLLGDGNASKAEKLLKLKGPVSALVANK